MKKLMNTLLVFETTNSLLIYEELAACEITELIPSFFSKNRPIDMQAKAMSQFNYYSVF